MIYPSVTDPKLEGRIGNRLGKSANNPKSKNFPPISTVVLDLILGTVKYVARPIRTTLPDPPSIEITEDQQHGKPSVITQVQLNSPPINPNFI
jgi:hypothetical protein